MKSAARCRNLLAPADKHHNLTAMNSFPSLFVSHGAPTLVIDDVAAHHYLKSLGADLGKPDAIVIVSAHHEALEQPGRVEVTTSAHPPMIYDFRGFPEALYRMTYPAPGTPALADAIIKRLRQSGFDAVGDDARGYDHGAWVPLMLMYGHADVPVIQLSINMGQSPEWHMKLGEALSPLRNEGVLLIGSGNITHNLRAFFEGRFRLDSPAPDWVTGFTDWLNERIEAGDRDAVLNAVEIGPGGRQNHPTMDHILPLFFALGAGGADGAGKRLHHSLTYGVLAMDVYGFGAGEAQDRLKDQ